MTADGLTKPLGQMKFEIFVTKTYGNREAVLAQSVRTLREGPQVGTLERWVSSL